MGCPNMAAMAAAAAWGFCCGGIIPNCSPGCTIAGMVGAAWRPAGWPIMAAAAAAAAEKATGVSKNSLYKTLSLNRPNTLN